MSNARVNEPTESELEELAAQLRRPHGAAGRDIGRRLTEGNATLYGRAIEAASISHGERVLEIGMGPGSFVRDMLSAAPEVQYLGVDFSELMVDEAEHANADAVATGTAKFYGVDVESPGFSDVLPDSSFDVAISVNTLYFVDPFVALGNVLRALRPGGRLVVAIRPRHVMVRYPFVKYGFQMFSADELSALLVDAGYSLSSVDERDEEPRQIGDETLPVASLVAVAIAPQEPEKL